MAEYCRQCSLKIHGRDHRDLARLCEPGETAWELCEGCGEVVEIDHVGMRVERDDLGAIANGAGQIHRKPGCSIGGVIGSLMKRIGRWL